MSEEQGTYETRKESQLSHIKKLLLDGGSVTPIEALNKFGIFRLSSIIHLLRWSHGLDIETEMTYIDNKRFAKYFIKK